MRFLTVFSFFFSPKRFYLFLFRNLHFPAEISSSMLLSSFYVAAFPPQTLTEFICLFKSSVRLLIIFTSRLWNSLPGILLFQNPGIQQLRNGSVVSQRHYQCLVFLCFWVAVWESACLDMFSDFNWRSYWTADFKGSIASTTQKGENTQLLDEASASPPSIRSSMVGVVLGLACSCSL